ncbi:MAG: hypothetical protein LBF64_05575, partial [Oscillospiraceae bacterium]|nr:hypothetical protein [Oscillospiraceae bacterium]
MKHLPSHKIFVRLLAAVLAVAMVFPPLPAFADTAGDDPVTVGYALVAEYDMSHTGTALTDISGHGHDAAFTSNLTSYFAVDDDGDIYIDFPGGTTSRYVNLPDGIITGEDFVIEATYHADTAADQFLWCLGTRVAAWPNVHNYIFLNPRQSGSTIRAGVKDGSYGSIGGEKLVTGGAGDTDGYTTTQAVFNNGLFTLYQDGVKIGENNTSYTVEDVLRSGVADKSAAIGFIGRSLYSPDAYFDGQLTHFKVYGKIRTDTEIFDAAYEALSIPGADNVRGNITLPEATEDGVQISWQSSDPVTVNAEKRKNANYDDTPAGVVTRGGEDKAVTLTATLTYKDLTPKVKMIPVVVKRAAAPHVPTHYLFVHFTGSEGSASDEQVYFSAGQDGLHFTDLNGSQPILRSTVGEGGVRDMNIVRSPEGDTFYLIATDLSIYNRGGWGSAAATNTGSHKLVVWESENLVDWSEPRLVRVAPDKAGMAWAPEAFYDEKTGEYVVFWASTMDGRTQVYYAKTRDFYSFTEAKPFVEHTDVIDTTVALIGDNYYRASKFDGNGSSNIFLQRVSRADGILGSWSHYISLAGSKNSTVYAGIGSATNYYASGGSALEGPEFYQLHDSGDWILMADRYGNGTGYVPFRLRDMDDTDTWSVLSD